MRFYGRAEMAYGTNKAPSTPSHMASESHRRKTPWGVDCEKWPRGKGCPSTTGQASLSRPIPAVSQSRPVAEVRTLRPEVSQSGDTFHFCWPSTSPGSQKYGRGEVSFGGSARGSLAHPKPISSALLA